MVFIFDWDGTLGGKTGIINDHNKKALNFLSSKGHKIYIATGRHFNSIKNIVEGLPIEDLIICTNGAVIVNKKTENYEIMHSLEKSVVKKIFDKAEKAKKTFGYGNKNSIFWRHFKDKDLIKIPNRELVFKKFKKTDWKEIDKGISIFGFFCSTEREEKEIHDFMLNNFDKNSPITKSGDGFVQIAPNNISKWSGILELLKMEKINNEKIVAFGDGGNDLTMIDNSHIGVAMSHSSDLLKSKADFVLEDKEDAIFEYILNNF